MSYARRRFCYLVFGSFGKTEQPNVFLMKNLSASFDESESEIKIEYLAKFRQKRLKFNFLDTWKRVL